MSLIAYCGLNCEKCPAYQATQDNDQTLREKVAVEWSKEFNWDLTAEDINCDGCQSVEGAHFSYCFECPMRPCAMKRSISTCADCAEYPCGDLEEFLDLVPEAKATLEGIREAK